MYRVRHLAHWLVCLARSDCPARKSRVPVRIHRCPLRLDLRLETMGCGLQVGCALSVDEGRSRSLSVRSVSREQTVLRRRTISNSAHADLVDWCLIRAWQMLDHGARVERDSTVAAEGEVSLAGIGRLVFPIPALKYVCDQRHGSCSNLPFL